MNTFQTSTKNNIKIPLKIVIALSLFLVSCDESYLNQAKKFSDTSQKLKEVFPEQASDYVESCFRAANYTLILPRDPDPFTVRQANRKDCEDKSVTETKQLFIAQNEIIVTYLEALGNLANDNNFVLLGDDHKKRLENIINTATGRNSSSNNNSASIFSSLISFIYEKAAKEYASKEIKTEVKALNPDFQKSVCLFKQGWTRVYSRNLEQEQKNINSFYKNTIRNMLQRANIEFEQTALDIQRLRQDLYGEPSTRDRLPTNYVAYPEIYNYDTEWQQKLDELQQRKSILNKYIEVLDTIAVGHAALEKASGGKGKGQETYCVTSTESSIAIKTIVSQISPKRINEYLAHLEKLIHEVETLQFANKNE